MAVLFKRIDNDSEDSHFQVNGVLIDGTLIGTEKLKGLLGDLNLQAENAEEELARMYDNPYMMASRIPDDEVDVDEYREQFQ